MSVEIVDLRSDTVTRPDARMRRAMAEAEVGDDVYREDPTVRRLEERAAEEMGKEAALFMPSGTMANQTALHLHGRPGGEVVAEADCHIFHYEMGAMAAISGLLPRPVAGERGLLDPERVERAIFPAMDYHSRTEVIAVENTHNLAGGTVAAPELGDRLVEVARRHRLPTHLDGARIFNAAVALEVPPARLAAGFDSVMFSLSKGLGAPVGSMLCGERDFVDAARRVRKMLGGGMRQVGILAAAGLVALEEGPGQLAEDHANARCLGEALAALPGLTVDVEGIETNILMVDLDPGALDDGGGEGTPATRFAEGLAEVGVLAVPMGRERLRLVTHRDVGREALEQAVERIRTLLTL